LIVSEQARTEQQAALLRAIPDRLGLPPVRTLARAPDVRAVYRVTVYYHDRRALDSCATLIERRHSEPEMAIAFRGAFRQKPILHRIDADRCAAFVLALRHLRFDHLPDQPRMPLYGLDFWMIERAAGSFIHSVILAPQIAEGVHAELAHIIRTHLPEALRAIVQE
jgi:hypothetical protein